MSSEKNKDDGVLVIQTSPDGSLATDLTHEEFGSIKYTDEGVPIAQTVTAEDAVATELVLPLDMLKAIMDFAETGMPIKVPPASVMLIALAEWLEQRVGDDRWKNIEMTAFWQDVVFPYHAPGVQWHPLLLSAPMRPRLPAQSLILEDIGFHEQGCLQRL